MEKGIFEKLFGALPKWTCADHVNLDSWGIDWRPPTEYLEYYPRVAGSKVVQDRVIERCQLILNTPAIVEDWVEIFFRPSGLTINVPGDATGIYPGQDALFGIGNHNIDTATQCIALQIFLITALGVLYNAMAVLERNSANRFEQDSQDAYYKLNKSLNSMEPRLFELRDQRFTCVGLVGARTHQEARENADKLLPNTEIDRVVSCLIYVGALYSNLRLFMVRVSFLGGLPDQMLKVIADSGDEAVHLVKERDSEQLRMPFSSVANVSVIESAPLLSQVL